MTKTNRPRGPLTEAQKKLIEDHWPMVVTIICRLAETNRIRRDHIDLAFSIAGRIAMSAARSYDGATARFSTYLWIPLVKYLPTKIAEYRSMYDGDRAFSREYARDVQRVCQARGDAWRKPALIDKANEMKGHAMRTLLAKVKDERPGPDRVVEENEAASRVEQLLAECEDELPRPGSLLRRVMAGESTDAMAAEAGTSREAINYQIRTAKRWMAWRLFGDADWTASGAKSGRGRDREGRGAGHRKAVRDRGPGATGGRVGRSPGSRAAK